MCVCVSRAAPSQRLLTDNSALRAKTFDDDARAELVERLEARNAELAVRVVQAESGARLWRRGWVGRGRQRRPPQSYAARAPVPLSRRTVLYPRVGLLRA